jgi:hypothetical protein
MKTFMEQIDSLKRFIEESNNVTITVNTELLKSIIDDLLGAKAENKKETSDFKHSDREDSFVMIEFSSDGMVEDYYFYGSKEEAFKDAKASNEDSVKVYQLIAATEKTLKEI